MARDPDEDDLDEEALSWGDPRDATHVESPHPVAPRADEGNARDDLDRVFPDATAEHPDDPDDVGGPQLGSLALVGMAIVGGIYLLYAVGWLNAVVRIGVPFGDDQLFQRLMYQLGEVLAVLAAPLWFAVTVVLARRDVVRRGLIWLILGLIILPPWPVIMGVA